ncbi:hypothetical protein MTR_0268s0070 [Medicago truncatula]|uniref:Uncharacterized protein n=1 Tax=Medicago truncatula TaxID=3880 RepID=A0A072TRP8_MEDTR|nr:hypothetical protein MTR_0268s0070 [Medicago truncatula]
MVTETEQQQKEQEKEQPVTENGFHSAAAAEPPKQDREMLTSALEKSKKEILSWE